WFRLRISNQSSRQWLLRLQYAQLSRVDYLLLNDQGMPLANATGGNAVPLQQSPLANAPSTFSLPIPQGQTATLYLRATSSYSLQLPLTICTQQALLSK